MKNVSRKLLATLLVPVMMISPAYATSFSAPSYAASPTLPVPDGTGKVCIQWKIIPGGKICVTWEIK